MAGLITGRGFDRHLDALRALCAANGLNVEVTYCRPTDNPALRLDLDGPGQVGRMTAWELGECDVQVLDVATGATVLWEHHERAGEEGFHAAWRRLAAFMGEAAGRPDGGAVGGSDLAGQAG